MERKLKMKINISADMGESFGAWKMGYDEELMQYITSANIACGFHAGDPMMMRYTVKLAIKNGVKIGTHVGLPDLLGFGRRSMAISPEEYLNYSLYQGGALQAIARAEGEELQHFTWHGSAGMAFYSDNEELARAGATAVSQLDKNLIIPVMYGPRGDLMAQEAGKLGLKVMRQFFVDRPIQSNGTLVSRKEPGAVLKDPEFCADRVLKMVEEGKVTAIDGKEIDIHAQSLMVHGDSSGAIKLAKAVWQKLEAAGVELVPLNQII